MERKALLGFNMRDPAGAALLNLASELISSLTCSPDGGLCGQNRGGTGDTMLGWDQPI